MDVIRHLYIKVKEVDRQKKSTKPKSNKVELANKIHGNTCTCKTCNEIEPHSAQFNKDQYTLHCTVASTNTFIIFQMTLPMTLNSVMLMLTI